MNPRKKGRTLDAAAVKSAATGRWIEILAAAGIAADLLDGKGHPCPKCGGDDRFAAHTDIAERGAVICRTCLAKGCGDGLAAVAWIRGTDFADAVRWVGEFLRIGTTHTDSRKPNMVARYNYRDAQGELRYQVVRYEPKDFRQRRPKPGGGWIWGTKGVEALPYRLAELLAEPSRWVVVAEGEKDCDNLARIGVLATCNHGGAGKWTATHAKYLAGRRVVVLPDNDDAGEQHAKQVAASLQGIAEWVRVVRLPNLPPKGDVSDWIAAGGTKDELGKLTTDTPEWAPIPTPTVATVTEAPKLEYAPFPTAALPTPVSDFIEAGSQALGCDPAYIALPTLAALAAAVGTTRRVQLKRSWCEPCVLWAVTIGRSGTMKSPAWELGIRPVQRLQDAAFRFHAQQLAQYKADKADYDQEIADWKKQSANKRGPKPNEPDEPGLSRYIASDCTVEALANLLEGNPRGLLLARDELSGWLSSFDAYKGVRGADVAQWLSMHRAGAVTVDRKTGKTVMHIPRAAVSIAGSVQPAILKLALCGRVEGEEGTKEHFSNGLAARLLMAYPPPRPKRWTDADLSPALQSQIEIIFTRLYDLQMAEGEYGPIPVDVSMSFEARQQFITFYNEHAAEAENLGDDLAAAWSKLEGYAARFALLVQLVSDAANGRFTNTVDLPAIESGITLSRWFADEAARIYQDIGGSADTAESRAIRGRSRLAEIIRSKGGSVTPRDLMRASRNFRDADSAEAALQGLVDAGIGTWGEIATTSRGGRPTRRFVLSGSADAVDTDETTVKPDENAGCVNVNAVNGADSDADNWGEV